MERMDEEKSVKKHNGIERKREIREKKEDLHKMKTPDWVKKPGGLNDLIDSLYVIVFWIA